MIEVAVVLAIVAIALALLALRHRPEPRFAGSVALSDATLAWRDPSGRERRFALADIHAVDVVTTAQGPAVEDYFFVLWIGEETVPIPIDAVGATALHEWVMTLPGADLEALTQSAGSTSDRTFPIWRR